jgi:hypothetical protein
VINPLAQEGRRGVSAGAEGEGEAWEPEPPSMLDTVYSLGMLCSGQSKLKEAKEVYQQR